MTKQSISRVVFALALLIGLAQCGRASEDWQYWSTWKASHDLSEQATVSALAEVYFRDDMTDDYVYDEYITYTRSMGSGLSVLASAYFVSSEGEKDTWKATRSAVGGIIYSTEIPHVCRVKLMERIYYKINSNAGWDYHRPRVILSRKWGAVTVALSDELRMDLTGDREDTFFRNRIQAMVSRPIKEGLSLGIGYVRQSDRVDDEWKSINVLQTVVACKF